jgi:hypothetical protein
MSNTDPKPYSLNQISMERENGKSIHGAANKLLALLGGYTSDAQPGQLGRLVLAPNMFGVWK